MAAPVKQGLDYFPHEIGLMQDRKLRKVKMKYGCIATSVYMALLEMIYGDKGYYIAYAEYKDDVIWQILEFLQGKFQPSAETVSDVIDGLADAQLFSTDCYPKIITSKRVQQTYYSATVDRKAVSVDFEIWMLSIEEMKALSSKSLILQEFINRANNGVNRANNEVNRANNSQSKVKESNVSKKESIDKEEINNHPRESYETVMDDMCLEEEVKPMMWSFIKHCQLNGKTLTNDKLVNILFEMDKQRLSPAEKIQALEAAVNGGYYDIKRQRKD